MSTDQLPLPRLYYALQITMESEREVGGEREGSHLWSRQMGLEVHLQSVSSKISQRGKMIDDNTYCIHREGGNSFTR